LRSMLGSSLHGSGVRAGRARYDVPQKPSQK
jgi:hypothetical protein